VANSNPVIVEIRRGTGVESWHRGSRDMVETQGTIVEARGDKDQAVFPRSAVKPLQAIALIETGAAQHFRIIDQEIALACASHSGEPMDTRLVSAWLRRCGLAGEDLVCGPHTPLSEDVAQSLLRGGGTPSPFTLIAPGSTPVF